MKHVRIVLFLCVIQPGSTIPDGTLPAKNQRKEIEVNIKQQWHNLDANKEQWDEFGGKWIDAGILTVKKRTKDPLSLTHLILSWQGNKIEQLIGSLYQRKPNKEFLPIEQNLICDSHWHQKDQRLIFKFLQPLSLDSLTELHVVLTVPPALEQTLQEGSLKVEADHMPDLMRKLLTQQSVTLTFNAHPRTYAIS